jgi:hypothetical protein
MPLALRFRRQIAGVLSGARTRSIIAWSCLVLVLYGLEVANAATEANAESAVGINLQQVNYYSPEQPFLNIFRTSGVAPSIPAQWIGGWLTHSIANGTWDTGEEAHLQASIVRLGRRSAPAVVAKFQRWHWATLSRGAVRRPI